MVSSLIRTCTKCGEDKPATREFFYAADRGLRGDCKQCYKKRAKATRDAAPKNPVAWCVETGTRKCSKCEEVKPATPEHFTRNRSNKVDGCYSVCKSCQAKWRDENRDGPYKQQAKSYRLRHANKHRAASRKWYEENKGRAKENHVRWCKENREKRAISTKRCQKNRMKDPSVKIEFNLRSRFKVFISGPGKSKKLRRLVGCTRDQLRAHLESQFKPGMSWDNYGVDGWHIDHIRPCCSFDLTDPEQQKECFHYSNLQPLWASENLSKGGKWEAA